MRIEIDTTKDTKEDIKKLIKMLQAIIEEGSSWGAQDYKGPSEMVGLGFMDIDNTGSSSTANTASSPQTKKDDDDIPRVELY